MYNAATTLLGVAFGERNANGSYYPAYGTCEDRCKAQSYAVRAPDRLAMTNLGLLNTPNSAPVVGAPLSFAVLGDWGRLGIASQVCASRFNSSSMQLGGVDVLVMLCVTRHARPCCQTATAAGMAAAVTTRNATFVLTVGDNFYSACAATCDLFACVQTFNCALTVSGTVFTRGRNFLNRSVRCVINI